MFNVVETLVAALVAANVGRGYWGGTRGVQGSCGSLMRESGAGRLTTGASVDVVHAKESGQSVQMPAMGVLAARLRAGGTATLF